MIAYNKKTYLGLSQKEAKDRLALDGFNEIPKQKAHSIWAIVFSIMKEPMFILLLSCGLLYLMLGDKEEGIMLLGFVFVVIAIEFYQERKSEKALAALKELSSPRALVIRDGEECRIAGRELVIGDLLVLQEGDRVPADAEVLQSTNLQVDESLLTGESVPVTKIQMENFEESESLLHKEEIYVYSGTMIVQGNGFARVKKVGQQTELGKIGRALESTDSEPVRLKAEMSRLIKKISIIGLLLCVLVVLLYTLTRGDLLKGFLAGITLAMAVLPEEFPLVLSVFFAIGAWRMSRRKVLTRKPSAIETLGSATVLCTDKTGTLTENKMTVSYLYNKDEILSLRNVTELGHPYHQIIEYAILSSQINPYDPMEKAINTVGEKYLFNSEHLHGDWEMLREYPLSKELLAMSRVYRNQERGLLQIASKGAPEAIFDLCHLGPVEQALYSEKVQSMAGLGLRVLGVAKAEFSKEELPEVQHDFNFVFVGLIGLSDPIRKEVPQAIKECHEAGVRVIMITGDYPVTAQNIAKEIGLQNPEEFLTGQELKQMSEEELSGVIQRVNIFARILPEQKLKIVNALKRNKEIVAMTGDGVNDAPALKAAHIGIAMGLRGTDVAREASSLVLLDDHFGSIVEAIKMGRRIYDNLQKAMAYIFAIHVPIAGISLVPVLLLDMPLILWPVHVVLMELIIDPACSIIFEAEAAEANCMQRAPRSTTTPFFGSKKILISCMQGFCILLACLIIYFGGWKLKWDEGVIRAMTFVCLLVANMFTILTNRAWNQSLFSILRTPNPVVKWVVGAACLFLTLILTNPFLLKLFQFSPISVPQLILSISLGASSIIWFELYKRKNRNRIWGIV